MNIKLTYRLAMLVALAVMMTGCKVKYSFTGASISPDAKTFSVSYFPNNAAMVAPILSSTLTDALQDKFLRQTRLSQVREGGDLHVEGEITGYTSTPASISADEYAIKNRLTVTVKVRFTNTIEPQYNFSRNFTAYLEYDSSILLQQAEVSLIPQLVDILCDDIFNAATSNW